MVKVITPVQYESPMGGLNEVRPLEISGEVKPFIDTSILNINPVDTGRPAKGRLLRCGNDSAVLQNCVKGFRHVENVPVELDDAHAYNSFTFSQKVDRVLWYSPWWVGAVSIFWCHDAYWLLFQELSLDVPSWVPFTGKTIHLIGSFIGGGSLEANLYGFYN